MSDPTEVIQTLWEQREKDQIRIGRAKDALERGLSFIDGGSYQGHGRISLANDLATVIREALAELDVIPRD